MTAKFPELASAVAPAQPMFRFANLIRTPQQTPAQGYIHVNALTLEFRRFAALQIAESTRNIAPRLMVIAGPPGAGKSQGALFSGLACNFAVATVSCSMFASEVEGGATAVLNAMLEEFERYSALHRLRVMVVLDDFDLSIVARDDKTGVSSNTNLLTERIQYLADNRHIYRNFDGSNIAFVLTINNAEMIRSSLLRDMRATWIEHDPDGATKSDIAYRILDPQTAEERAFVDRLIRRHAKQSIAFWKALRMDIDAARLDGLLAHGLPDAREIDAVMGQRTPLDPAVIEMAARKRSKSRIRNFLFGR